MKDICCGSTKPDGYGNPESGRCERGQISNLEKGKLILL